MKKKAFTFFEITLVMAVVAIIAASAIPFMLKTFTGYNEIANQADIVNKLQEISSVITRRIVLNKEVATKDHINEIIQDLALEKVGSIGYKMHNNIVIKKLEAEDLKDCTYTKDSKSIKITNCLKVNLTAYRENDQNRDNDQNRENEYKLSFIVYPVFN